MQSVFFQAAMGMLGVALSVGLPTSVQGQIRILDYNVAASSASSSGPRAGMDTVLQAIGDQARAGFARPIDIMFLQEGNAASTTGQAYADLLNSLTSGTAYRASTISGSSTGSGRPLAVYNSAAVTLISEQAIGTVGTTVQPRQTMRYQFRPVGYDAAADFYVYNSHLKSASDSTSERRRTIETTNNRADADALGEGVNVIYVGDLNLYSSADTSFQALVAPGNGQAHDPIGQVGDWSDNAAYKPYHTQSPATTAAYGGQITGGIDDRFDFQLLSGEWLDGRGLDYIAGSYWAFGNTDTHALSGAVTTGDPAALQAWLPGYSLARSGTVLANLARVTDHLPVVADYQLPARMTASLATGPARVITGAVVSATVSVANSAPVGVVQGADRLDYGYSGSGICVGSGTGSDLALGAGNTHRVVLSTAAVGLVSGSVSVTATSPQTATPLFVQPVTMGVLDHALGSFSSTSTTMSLDVDFGTLTQGTGPASRTFSISNRAGPLGASWTAMLDLDGVVASVPDGIFSTTLSPFTNLAAGSAATYGLSMLTTTTGSFSGSYLLNLSDEDLPGATTQHLSLTLRGSVVSPDPVVLHVAAGAQTQADLGFAAITGTTSVVKTGGGTAILTATNTFSGATALEQGILTVASADAIGRSSLITVATDALLDVSGLAGGYTVSSGQTLAGSGTVHGSVIFGRGSTLSPGSSLSSGMMAAQSASAAGLASDSAAAVPEPAAGLLAALGLLLAGSHVAVRRRQSRVACSSATSSRSLERYLTAADGARLK